MLQKIITICNAKGGVGKTTSTASIGACMAIMGKKVLLVDLDGQANLTLYFIPDDDAIEVSIFDSLVDGVPLPIVNVKENLDIVPSSLEMASAEIALTNLIAREQLLGKLLAEVKDRYDYILIDTSPSLGALNINAMAAADEVIVTVNPQLLAMMGLQDFLKSVKKIKSRLNEKLNVAGILLTMCDARTILCKTITEQVAETFQGQIRIFESKIPNTVKVGESVYYSEPLIEYAPDSNACRAYNKLAGEVIAYES